MPKIIYGMAKFSKPTYGYGSQPKDFDQNKFSNFLSLFFSCSSPCTLLDIIGLILGFIFLSNDNKGISWIRISLLIDTSFMISLL